MNASIISFCHWLEDGAVGTAIRESVWGFSILVLIHVLALGLSAGTIAAVDLRLLGRGMRSEPVSAVLGQVLPWTWTGFAIMAVSGGLVFVSEAERCYTSVSFRIKMALMLLAGLNALVFHLTIYRRVAAWDRDPVTPLRAKFAGLSSLVLWLGVITAGRFVGYEDA